MRRRWLVVAALLGVGCSFSVDARVVKPPSDAGGQGEDAAPLDEAATPFADSGEALDATQPESSADDDAGMQVNPAPDAGPGEDADPPNEPDTGAGEDAAAPIAPDACPPEGCPPPCGEDSECSAEQYCSRASGSCAPRCDQTRGCVGERARDVHSMLADGETLYWSSENVASDVLGQPARKAGIWSWNLRDEAVTLNSGLLRPDLRFVADGSLYYIDDTGDGIPRWDLWRVRVSPPASSEIVAQGANHAWKAGQFLFWSTTGGASTMELWRKPLGAGGSAQRLAMGQHDGWYGGNEEFAFHVERQNGRFAVIADQLSDLTATREIVGYEATVLQPEKLIVAGTMLYFTIQLITVVHAVDSAAPGPLRLLSPDAAPCFHFSDHAGWLYWSVSVPRETNSKTWEIIYGRTHGKTGMKAPILLQRSVGDGAEFNTQFSVIGQQLVYWNQPEERFFTLALPPLPCSDTVPCPSGQSCTAAMVCQ